MHPQSGMLVHALAVAKGDSVANERAREQTDQRRLASRIRRDAEAAAIIQGRLQKHGAVCAYVREKDIPAVLMDEHSAYIHHLTSST